MTVSKSKHESLKIIVEESINELLKIHVENPHFFLKERERGVQCHLYAILSRKKFKNKKLGEAREPYKVSYLHPELPIKVSSKNSKPVDITIGYPKEVEDKKGNKTEKWEDCYMQIFREMYNIEIKKVTTAKLSKGIKYDIKKLCEIKKQFKGYVAMVVLSEKKASNPENKELKKYARKHKVKLFVGVNKT